MDVPISGQAPNRRDADASRDAGEFAWMSKPLPPEPLKWVRLRPTWRSWAASGLGWFTLAVLVVGWLIPKQSGVPAPGWFLWASLVVGIVWIGAIVPRGVADRVLAARLEAARRRDPARPWLWDHRWDPRGVSGSPFRRLLVSSQRLIGPMFFPVWMLVFGPAPVPVVWFWGTVSGVAATWVAWKAWRIYGVGTAHVTFTRFPYHPGERVTLHFGMSEGGAQFQRAAFCLRRIEVARGISPLEFRGARRYFGIRAERPPGELPGSDHHVAIEFDLPADVAGTHLSASPPSYWTLDVIANTSAGPYVESFLIPIYERPAAPVAA
jgi:hypothetical protein